MVSNGAHARSGGVVPDGGRPTAYEDFSSNPGTGVAALLFGSGASDDGGEPNPKALSKNFDEQVAAAAPDAGQMGEAVQHGRAGMPRTGVGASGRGRRFIDSEDHQVTQHREHPDMLPYEFGMGRRGVVPDHLRPAAPGGAVLDGVREVLSGSPQPQVAPPSTADLKSTVREWVEEAHGIVIYDERRWQEAVLRQHGQNWALQAFTERRREVSREGQTARTLAEKLAQLTNNELRHFGLRYEAKRSDTGQGQHPTQANPADVNPTMVSQGVRDALQKECRASSGIQQQSSRQELPLSAKRKDPEDMRRRYIRSGADDSFQSGMCPGR
jgi:hypothetical protein